MNGRLFFLVFLIKFAISEENITLNGTVRETTTYYENTTVPSTTKVLLNLTTEHYSDDEDEDDDDENWNDDVVKDDKENSDFKESATDRNENTWRRDKSWEESRHFPSQPESKNDDTSPYVYPFIAATVTISVIFLAFACAGRCVPFIDRRMAEDARAGTPGVKDRGIAVNRRTAQEQALAEHLDRLAAQRPPTPHQILTMLENEERGHPLPQQQHLARGTVQQKLPSQQVVPGASQQQNKNAGHQRQQFAAANAAASASGV